MKTIKTFVLISVIITGSVGLVFASWWNPFTWFTKKVAQAQKVKHVNTSNNQTDAWKVYQNSTYKFEIKYPSYLNLVDDRPTIGGQNLWATAWSLPQDYYKGTKISEVGVDVYLTNNPCRTDGDKVTVNGITFDVSTSDTGSSKDSTRTESLIYSAEINSVCYEFSSGIHYSDSNLLLYNSKTGSYEMEGKDLLKKTEEETARSREKIFSLLKEIVATFKFIKSL